MEAHNINHFIYTKQKKVKTVLNRLKIKTIFLNSLVLYKQKIKTIASKSSNLLNNF